MPMAGVSEQLRRSRAREALGPSVVRSAPVPMRGNSAPVSGTSKQPKAPAKRAANEDNQRMISTVPPQQAKRRAALSNLTNQSHLLSGLTNGPLKPRATNSSKNSSHSRIVSSKHEASERTNANDGLDIKNTAVTCEESIAAIAQPQDDVKVEAEMVTPYAQPKVASGVVLEHSVELEVDDAEVDPIAALERETKQSLYISSNHLAQRGSLHLCEEQTPEMKVCNGKRPMELDSNHRDPQLCSSYAKDIYQYLRISELKRRPIIDYMDSVQQDINSCMRGILIDWLVEVAEEYKLVPDTLYLTVSYIDRFLSAKVVNRQRLQLLGVACMLVAAKYEEICSPQVEEFCYITDNTYSKEELLDMERQVLNQLHFELTGPTTKTFLRRFLRAAQSSLKSPTLHLEYLGNFLAELTLVEHDFLKYLPSMVAASSVFVAKFTLEPHLAPWNSTLQQHTGYKPSELKECVNGIHGLQHNVSGCTLPAIREKYQQHKFKFVARATSPPVIPPDYFEDSTSDP